MFAPKYFTPRYFTPRYFPYRVTIGYKLNITTFRQQTSGTFTLPVTTTTELTLPTTRAILIITNTDTA